MAQADARQWQRFGYPADVQLRYEPVGLQPARPLAAVSFDLSLGGMQLRAAGGLALGARVSCKLPQAHGGLQLPARVRWCRPDAAHGSPLRFRMGLEFEPMRGGVQQHLQAIVSQVEHAGEIVKVQLPSWSEPLCAVTEPSEHGVRLRLPLPFWSGGSIVRFEPLQDTGALEGRVVSTQLRPAAGSQGVELELLLSPCEPARKRRYLQYEEPAHNAAELSARSREITEHVPLAVPKTRINGLLLQGAIVTALFWVGFGVTEYLTPARVPSLRSRAQEQAPKDTETRVHAASSGVAPAFDTTTLAATSPTAPAAISSSSSSPSAPSADVKSSDAAVDPKAEPEPEPEVEASAKEPPLLAGPTLSSTHDTTEIFVPVSGPVVGLASALWVDPPAVVVDVPTGKLELPQERYDLHAGGVSTLRVGKVRGVTQVRVYLTTVLSRFDALPARGGLVIRLKRDLQSLPRSRE